MLSRLLGWLVTLALLFLLLDGLVRLLPFFPPTPAVEFNERWGWANIHDSSAHRKTGEYDIRYHVNSKGLRGPEAEYARGPHATRILFVGDSFTLGFTVDEDDIFHRVVERDLRARGHDVEVLNGGTEGFSTDQEYSWLVDEGMKYHPDYVVFAPYLNDVMWNLEDHYTNKQKPKYELAADGKLTRTNPALVDTTTRSWFALHTGFGKLSELIKNSRLLPMTSVGGAQLPAEFGPVLSVEPPDVARAWRTTDALIKAIADTARAGGAKPVALLVPNKWEIHPDIALPASRMTLSDLAPAKPTDRFRDACTAAGFTVVDPRSQLRARGAKERVYHEKDFHWNVAGNEAVAEALVAAFETPALLGPGNGTPIAHASRAHVDSSIPTWWFVVGGLWILLSLAFWRTYPDENPVMALLKVGALIGGVVLVFKGVFLLAAMLPPSIGGKVVLLIGIIIVGFVLWKIGRRMGVILELYNTMLRRGHWYMLPMLVVMLAIGMLLVVAASSPFVAPFIYTLF